MLRGLVCSNKSSAFINAGVIATGNVQPLHRAQPHPQKDHVELSLQCSASAACIDLDATAKLHAQLANHLHLAQTCRRRAACTRPRRRCSIRLPADAARTPSPQIPAAPTPPRTPATPAPRRCTRLFRTRVPEMSSAVCHLAREKRPSHTAAAAQSRSAARCSDASRMRLRTAHPPDKPASSSPPEIRVQNRPRRTAQDSRRNLLDEPRHIDMRGTRRRARRIKAIQAAVRLDHRRLRRKAPDADPGNVRRSDGACYASLIGLPVTGFTRCPYRSGRRSR